MEKKSRNELLQLLQEKVCINFIKESLNIDKKTLLTELKELIIDGYQLERNIKSNGEIELFIQKDTPLVTWPIKVDVGEAKQFRAIFISDMHLGRKNDTLNVVNNMNVKNKKIIQ